MKTQLLITFSLLLLASCNLKNDEKINAEVVNETIRKRKIKRVLEDDIVATAFVMGQQAADSAQALLPKNPEELCRLFNFTERLSEPMQEWVAMAVIRCQPTLFHHPKEKELWNAYSQAIEQGVKVDGNVQRLGNKRSYQQLVYTLPINYEANGQTQWAMLSIVLDKSQVILHYEREG